MTANQIAYQKMLIDNKLADSRITYEDTMRKVAIANAVTGGLKNVGQAAESVSGIFKPAIERRNYLKLFK